MIQVVIKWLFWKANSQKEKKNSDWESRGQKIREIWNWELLLELLWWSDKVSGIKIVTVYKWSIFQVEWLIATLISGGGVIFSEVLLEGGSTQGRQMENVFAK